MTRALGLKKRIFLLIRYARLLLSIIFSDKNAVSLYISAMLFALITLGMYLVFSAIQNGLGISDTNWRSAVLMISLLLVGELVASIWRKVTTQSGLRRPNYPISRDSAEIARQLADQYLSRRNTSFLLRLKALAAMVLVICVSLVGILEQQMLRTMGGIASRITKPSVAGVIKVSSTKKF